MNSLRLGVALLVWCWGTLAVPGDEGRSDKVAGEPGDVLTAADFVQAALQAEGVGDAPRRAQLLKEALEHDPEYGPARWHSGYLRLQDNWLTIAESQEQYRGDVRLEAYQKFRASLPEAPDREWQLARWCQAQKLAEQAEFHWLNVLRMQPTCEEALVAMDARWLNGRLVKREELAKQKRADHRATRNTLNANPTLKRRCEALIASWERAAGEDQPFLLSTMETDLAAESGADVVPITNYLLGERSRAPRNPRKLEKVSVQWMTILARYPHSTKFLVVHAIGNPWESVRMAAAEALKQLPREEYVPLLLACAQFPAEFACSLLVSGGIVRAEYTVDLQGLDADASFQHADSMQRVAGIGPAYDMTKVRSQDNPQLDGKVFLSPVPEPPGNPALFAGAAVGKAQAMKAQVEQYNAAADAINRRVVETLARATGRKMDADPRTWQSWWQEYMSDYYEVEPLPANGQQAAGPQGGGQGGQPGNQPKRPVFQYQSWFDQRFARREGTQHTTWISCFDGETPVWTATGPRPIKEIQPGDRVLSQDATTGELAYKAVERVTTRQPSPLIRVTVSGEEILATRGHPFWVVGKRWVMAKHIQAGDLLHTVSGPLPVERADEVPAPEAWYEFAYNLQVEGFHTYFVGENQMLVHHLSMLSILDEGSSIVPGL
jgi:hypothetical protein